MALKISTTNASNNKTKIVVYFTLEQLNTLANCNDVNDYRQKINKISVEGDNVSGVTFKANNEQGYSLQRKSQNSYYISFNPSIIGLPNDIHFEKTEVEEEFSTNVSNLIKTKPFQPETFNKKTNNVYENGNTAGEEVNQHADILESLAANELEDTNSTEGGFVAASMKFMQNNGLNKLLAKGNNGFKIEINYEGE